MTRILGIETSCDETAAAIVDDGRVVKSSIVLSQIAIHARFGGVVPEVAARAHLQAIDAIVEEALAKAGCSLRDIDAISVTQGPGLIGALLVGIAYAKGLSLATGLPLVPVNHVEAHVHGALLGLKDRTEDLFPSLALVVSGGHSNIYYMKSATEFELMAYSIDDACGESFDKVAKLFGLGYPGGPAIEKLARDGDPKAISMPKMMEQKDKLQFSYSGLKTFMVNLNHKHKIEGQSLNDAAAAFQEEALGQLVRKLETVSKMRQAKCLLVAGGVAANQRFRDLVAHRLKIPAHFPQLSYCSDNAAMIAALGYHRFVEAQDKELFYKLDWDAFSRYQFA